MALPGSSSKRSSYPYKMGTGLPGKGKHHSGKEKHQTHGIIGLEMELQAL